MGVLTYDTSVFQSWPTVKADMIVQLKKKLASDTLSPEGIVNVQALIKDLERS